jgi:hypothetical protein
MAVWHVAIVDWVDVDGRSTRRLTCGTLLANEEVPRGPDMGCHVAPSQGRMESVKNVWGSMGFEPKTIHQAKHLKESTNTNVPHMSLAK